MRRIGLQNCRISGCSERTGKLVALDNPETTILPTELTTTNKSVRTNDNVQGNLLQNHEQKFANLPEHLELIKLCFNVGITKTVARGDSVGQNGRLMSTVYFTSRQRNIPSEMMDSWEHEDRPSIGGGNYSSSRPLRNRDHDRVPVG